MPNPCAKCGAALAQGAVVCFRCGALLDTGQGSLTEQARAPTALLTSARQGLVGGRWRLVEPAQKLRCATAFDAIDTMLDRAASVLVLDEAFAADAAVAQAFDAETQRFAGLSHPRIAALLGAGAGSGAHFRVTQYLEGGTLFEHVHERGGRLAVPAAAALLSQLVVAVRAVHAAGLTHGDVRPSNVRVSTDGRLLLSMPAAFAGVPSDAWAADAEPDAWGLGVIAHELLAGQLPPAPLPAEVPPALAEAVQACLSPDPAARRKGVEALESALGASTPSLGDLKLLAAEPVFALPSATVDESSTDELGPSGTVVEGDDDDVATDPPPVAPPGESTQIRPMPVRPSAPRPSSPRLPVVREDSQTGPLPPPPVAAAQTLVPDESDTRPLPPPPLKPEQTAVAGAPDTRRLGPAREHAWLIGALLAMPLTALTVWFWRLPPEGALPDRSTYPLTAADARVPPLERAVAGPQLPSSPPPSRTEEPTPLTLADAANRAGAFKVVDPSAVKRRIGIVPRRTGLRPGYLRISTTLHGLQVEATLKVDKTVWKEKTPVELKLPSTGPEGLRKLELELIHEKTGTVPVLYTYTAPVRTGLFLEVELDQTVAAEIPLTE